MLVCTKAILLKICKMLDTASQIYVSIALNFCKSDIKQLLLEHQNLPFRLSKRLNIAQCLEGCCFNGRKDLMQLFWRNNDPSSYFHSLRGACRNKQVACANYILKQPLQTLFMSEIFYIVLKSQSDEIVLCFLRNVNINTISKKEWSYLWNATHNDCFCNRWMNLIRTQFKIFNPNKQFTTPEHMFGPNYRF